MKHLPEHYRPLFRTLAGTGIRWGEAEALNVLAPRGGPLRHRTVYDSWKQACQRAGLDQQPRNHDLRHTHVAWLIAANIHLWTVGRCRSRRVRLSSSRRYEESAQ